MTDKEFKRLKRSDLIYIIYEYQKKQEELLKENQELRDRLAEKELKITTAGSLADVAAKLSGLFEAAQKTADDYMAHGGKLYTYRVDDIRIFDGSDSEGMFSGKSSDWDITLFTCTLSGRSRVAVRGCKTE